MNNMKLKSIRDLEDHELEFIERNGHLGMESFNIAELQFFYNQIEEERKRRIFKYMEKKMKI